MASKQRDYSVQSLEFFNPKVEEVITHITPKPLPAYFDDPNHIFNEKVKPIIGITDSCHMVKYVMSPDRLISPKEKKKRRRSVYKVRASILKETKAQELEQHGWSLWGEESEESIDRNYTVLEDQAREKYPWEIDIRTVKEKWDQLTEKISFPSFESKISRRIPDKEPCKVPDLNRTLVSCMETPSGSFYSGEKNELNEFGMDGFGTYVMPHGVSYVGHFKDGQFHGDGTLTYPNGFKIDGVFHNGKLIRWDCRYSDDLPFEIPWTYCTNSDRRFSEEIENGLQPAGRSLIFRDKPSPTGYYHLSGAGFLDPTYKYVITPVHQRVERLVTKQEEDWITENCYYESDQLRYVGYRPEMNKFWEKDIIYGTNIAYKDEIENLSEKNEYSEGSKSNIMNYKHKTDDKSETNECDGNSEAEMMNCRDETDVICQTNDFKGDSEFEVINYHDLSYEKSSENEEETISLTVSESLPEDYY